jgi:amino acid transporter
MAIDFILNVTIVGIVGIMILMGLYFFKFERKDLPWKEICKRRALFGSLVMLALGLMLLPLGIIIFPMPDKIVYVTITLLITAFAMILFPLAILIQYFLVKIVSEAVGKTLNKSEPVKRVLLKRPGIMRKFHSKYLKKIEEEKIEKGN